MPTPRTERKTLWRGSRGPLNPITRDFREARPSGGTVFGESVKLASSEGLFFSSVAAGDRIDQLGERGIAAGEPTGLFGFDAVRTLRQPFSGNAQRSPLPPEGTEGFITLEEAEKLLEANGLSVVDVPLTAAVDSSLGNTVHQPSLMDAIHVRSQQRRINQRISAGSDSLFRKGVAFTGGLVGSMLDPGDVATGFIPVGRAMHTFKYAERMGRTARAVGAGRPGITQRLREIGGATMRGARDYERQIARGLSQEGIAGRALLRAREGAIDGFGGALIMEPIVLANNTTAGRDYTITDSILNVTFGTMLGAGLHAGLGAISDGVQIAGLRADEAAARAQASGEFAQTMARLSPEMKAEFMAVAAIDAFHNREPDMGRVMQMFGLTQDGTPALNFRTAGDGSITFNGRVFRDLDAVMEEITTATGEFTGDAMRRLSEEFGLPPEAVAVLRTASGPPEGMAELLRFVAKKQAVDLENAQTLMRLTGRSDKLESMVEFLERTRDEEGSAFQRAKVAGYVEDGVSAAQFREMRAREQEEGLRFFRQEDQAQILESLGQLETMRRQLTDELDATNLDSPQKIKEWFDGRYRVDKQFDWDQDAIDGIARLSDEEKASRVGEVESAKETNEELISFIEELEDGDGLRTEIETISKRADDEAMTIRAGALCLTRGGAA